MKIYIITIHSIHNFGSVFQSYGLVKFLINNGYDAKIIDYQPVFYRKSRNVIRRIGGRLLNPISFFVQSRKYSSFIKKHLHLTAKRYTSLKSLGELSKENAIFISGGDQLWNNVHFSGRDDAYKLTFIKDKPKIAYGTSLGRSNFTSGELKGLASKLVGYSSIGLREQSTVKMLQPYTPIPIFHVADPVWLLKKEDYLQFISKKRIIKEPYMLMYLAASSPLLDAVVDYISSKLGLKVVHVCGFKKKCKCDYFLKKTGPEELLNLIYYSDFIISASFHATLFSIFFKKDFCTLLPEIGTNTRIEDLLDYFNLSDRIIHCKSEISNLNKKIDYSGVAECIETFAENSRHYLLSNLEKFK